MPPALTSDVAWEPLPAAAWDSHAARHLLRRAGWTARPDEVMRAVDAGLEPTLERLFPARPPLLSKPRLVARFEESGLAMQRDMGKLSADERFRVQREVQERSRLGLQELSVKWLEYAARPDSAAMAKWILFLSDIYVVSAEKVRNAAAIFHHFEILGEHALGSAPALAKAVSRSPAMLFYLDLGQSQLKSPNENFPRELFELFLLGEGNYTEADIKEAARAFTGYRARTDGTFRFDERQHDKGRKTVFGETGNLDGDAVIDLAYRQPAAARFLPRELASHYLTDTALPDEHIAALGEIWRNANFDLRVLARRFFGSRLFFAPEFRGGLIKSPVQLYLGLVQDLALNVAPLPRLTLTPLRQMGQLLFHPPNVRGWVGGRQWINSATLAARRQLVELLFAPLDEKGLNADELLELVAARSNGIDRFTVPDTAFASLAQLGQHDAVTALINSILPEAGSDAREHVVPFLAAGNADAEERNRRLRRVAITLLQSPEYQLC